jgi:hypothetical protein
VRAGPGDVDGDAALLQLAQRRRRLRRQLAHRFPDGLNRERLLGELGNDGDRPAPEQPQEEMNFVDPRRAE